MKRSKKNSSKTFYKNYFLFLLILIVVQGCSKKELPSYLANPALNRNYPQTDYLSTVGISNLNQQEAELQAKASIAGQLKSSIKVVNSSLIEEIKKDKNIVSNSEIISKIEVETDFDKAELIKTDLASSIKFEDKYYAFCYLPKDLLLQEYYGEYSQHEALFLKHYADVTNAYEKGEIELFKQNYTALAEMCSFPLRVAYQTDLIIFFTLRIW